MRADNLLDPTGLPDPCEPPRSCDPPDPRALPNAALLRIDQLLADGEKRLSRTDAPRLQAELLLAHALERPRSHLIAHARSSIDASGAQRYHELLARAVAGEPIAYLLGEREFWSLSFKVSPAVLIPRPETELVVERSLALGAASAASTSYRANPCRVCDLGTGSGAIALALALERPDWRITATDCSTAALELARLNAARLGVCNIEFVPGDWLDPLTGRYFDLIVSNPPYVAADDSALRALRYEPRVALTPGATGLEALERIVVQAPAHLPPGGWLILEHGADQAAALAQLLQARGYVKIQQQRDLAGCARVTEAQWPRQ